MSDTHVRVLISKSNILMSVIKEAGSTSLAVILTFFSQKKLNRFQLAGLN